MELSPFVLDTNAVIYLQRGLLDEVLPVGVYFISVITEIELLSFSGLSEGQYGELQRMIDAVVVVGLDADIKRCTIELRRAYRLKLPDALIVATALTQQAELLTNDLNLMARVPKELRCRALRLREVF